MAKRQRPNYGEIDAKILLSTRTNWQDIRSPIDNEKLDWARSEHKRSVYVKEMRDQWHANQCRKDAQTLLLRELDRLAELF